MISGLSIKRALDGLHAEQLESILSALLQLQQQGFLGMLSQMANADLLESLHIMNTSDEEILRQVKEHATQSQLIAMLDELASEAEGMLK